MSRSALFDAVEAERERLCGLAAELWDHPEVGLEETRAAALVGDTLREAGFDVETGVGGMPTALVASYGDGDPTVGLLGEYDALPDLSQRVAVERKPVEPGAPGHGCGHNLLGVAGVGAALALKPRLDDGRLEGTLRYYGCPAEETLVGKVFMARDGAFDDLDAALSWHPSDVTRPRFGSSLAMDSVLYTFEGTPAHAAQSPAAGRSALDAVELMNAGVEYLREHTPEKARIHYAITEGGSVPNVVPAEATVWYYVRAPTRRQVERLTERVDDVARGAARMTGTTLDRRFVTGCWEFLPNETLTAVMWDTLSALGPVPFTDEDRSFAAALQATIEESAIDARLAELEPAVREALRGQALAPEPFPPADEPGLMMGSTEVSDVSWLAPTAEYLGATWPVGTTAHTWQAVAASGDLGTRAMVHVAKALAGTAAELYARPELVAAAREDFERAQGDLEYRTPLPPDAGPPFDLTIG
ncbi:MAG: amidohydrolase [Halobacteriales archaeon]